MVNWTKQANTVFFFAVFTPIFLCPNSLWTFVSVKQCVLKNWVGKPDKLMLFLFFARSITIFLCQVRISLSVSFSLTHTIDIILDFFCVAMCRPEPSIGSRVRWKALSTFETVHSRPAQGQSLCSVTANIREQQPRSLCAAWLQLLFLNCWSLQSIVWNQFQHCTTNSVFMVKKLKEVLLGFNSYYNSWTLQLMM